MKLHRSFIVDDFTVFSAVCKSHSNSGVNQVIQRSNTKDTPVIVEFELVERPT